MDKCRVLIVSDHPLFAEGVGRLINGQAGLQVVGVTLPDEALTNIPSLGLDVVIVDADRATQATFSRMLRENPGVKFIGLSLDDNDINIYYQRNKISTGVETLVEAIREPLEWKLPERPKLRLLVVTQGVYGQRMADNIRLRAPDHWIVDQWVVPLAQPDSARNSRDLLPAALPAAELILSLGESPDVVMLLPDIVQMTGAKGVIAPIDDAAWLPGERVDQLREGLERLEVACVFPQPFCSLAEMRYNVRGRPVAFEDGPIFEFVRYFGQPAFEISVDADAQVLRQVKVLRDSPCGCARYVAERLSGISVDQAEQQVEALHHRFPCLASTTVDSDYGDSLLNVSSRILQNALRDQLEPFSRLSASLRSAGQFE
jgi:thymidylate synthase